MKTVQKLTSVFLAAIFLVSSLGFTANKMVCLKSGKVKHSLVQMKSCCPERNSLRPVIKSDCCDIVNTYFNIGDLHHSHRQFIVPSASLLFYSSDPYLSRNLNNFQQERLFYSYADLPPPECGRSVLSLISI